MTIIKAHDAPDHGCIRECVRLSLPAFVHGQLSVAVSRSPGALAASVPGLRSACGALYTCSVLG